MRSDIDLQALNAQLKMQGRRICPCCGRNLALSADNYYPKRDKKGQLTRWSSNCRECHKAIIREKGRERYRKDKAYRKYKANYRQAYFAKPENRTHHRERNRVYMRAKRRAKFAAILGLKR